MISGTRKIVAVLFVMLAVAGAIAAQGEAVRRFRPGERLSYNLSFGTFKDGGYAELTIASRGKLAGRDAVEIRSKLKTIGGVAASLMLIDETRTTFVDPLSGLPLFIRKTVLDGPLPIETTANYLETPTTSFDLVSLIYKLRETGGAGSYTFTEGEQVFTASFTPGNRRHVETEAGEFDTTVVAVESEFLSMRGIKDFKIDLTTDALRLPVVVRFKAQKGEFRATLAAVNVIPQSVPSQPGPDASPTPTPLVMQTPKPAPSPTPYIDNVPLLAELGFELGEKLSYRVTAQGQPVATIVVEATERKQFDKRDSLLLSATVTSVDRPNSVFQPGDALRVQVDPETLTPMWFEGEFGAIPVLSQTATFERTGKIAFGGKVVDAPVGTHTILSLMYAMRSFNLQPSKVLSNPVNDTRVAVFWDGKPAIFELRPSPAADISINGNEVSAQLITVTTRDPVLDGMGVKVWLTASTRVPLRYAVGPYQADLITP